MYYLFCDGRETVVVVVVLSL